VSCDDNINSLIVPLPWHALGLCCGCRKVVVVVVVAAAAAAAVAVVVFSFILTLSEAT